MDELKYFNIATTPQDDFTPSMLSKASKTASELFKKLPWSLFDGDKLIFVNVTHLESLLYCLYLMGVQSCLTDPAEFLKLKQLIDKIKSNL